MAEEVDKHSKRVAVEIQVLPLQHTLQMHEDLLRVHTGRVFQLLEIADAKLAEVLVQERLYLRLE